MASYRITAAGVKQDTSPSMGWAPPSPKLRSGKGRVVGQHVEYWRRQWFGENGLAIMVWRK